MISILSVPEYYDAFIKVTIIIIFAILLRSSLVYCSQIWAQTFAHSMSFVLLPVITFSVTSVISDNLALSLGLVGALSIVRFRNPVKSPFELTIYFLCISIGIACSASWKWPALLSFLSISIIFIAGSINKLSAYLNKSPIFTTSFSEGNSLNILEITTMAPQDNFLDLNSLISYSYKEDLYLYRFASNNKNELLYLSNSFSNKEQVVSVSFSVA